MRLETSRLEAAVILKFYPNLGGWYIIRAVRPAGARSNGYRLIYREHVYAKNESLRIRLDRSKRIIYENKDE